MAVQWLSDGPVIVVNRNQIKNYIFDRHKQQQTDLLIKNPLSLIPIPIKNKPKEYFSPISCQKNIHPLANTCLPTMTKPHSEVFAEAFERRKNLVLPVSISSLMNLFEVLICEQKTGANQFFTSTNVELFSISRQLQHAFRSKTKNEKIDFYAQLVTFLHQTIEGQKITSQAEYPTLKTLKKLSDSDNQRGTEVLNEKGYRKTGSMFSSWERVSLHLQVQSRTLKISGVSGELRVNLSNYYVRESKDKTKGGIVLESISYINEEQKIRLGFDDNCRDIKFGIYELILDAQKQQLFQELKESMTNGPLGRYKSQTNLDREDTFMDDGMLQEFRKMQNAFNTKQSDNNLDNSREILFQNSCKRISKANSDNVFYLEELFLLPKQKVMQALKLNSSGWNSMVKENHSIEKKDNYEVVYEKCLFQNRYYQFMYMREDKSSMQTGRVLLKSVPNKEMDRSKNIRPIDFRYCYIRVLPISGKQCKLSCEILMNINNDQNNQFMIHYLKQYSNLFEALKEQEESIKKQQLDRSIANYKKKDRLSRNSKRIGEENSDGLSAHDQTIYFSAFGGDEFMFFDDKDIIMEKDLEESESADSTKEKNKNNNMNRHQQNEKLALSRALMTGNTNSLSPELKYLKYKHQLFPSPTRPPLKLIKKHYMQDDWIKLKEGGIICINEKTIAEQKRVFTHVLSSFGKNILKSKNILNISLPVTIFKKQSHLKSIAFNFAYAPVILDQTTNMNSLERLKWTIVFVITVGTTGISCDKPFNPLLGETYQGLVNDCPISLEQISHHPPISSYYYQGRGYKAFGAIEPKISMGLNHAGGYSDRENKLVYDDGSVVEMSFMRLIIKGIMFGDRSFNFQNKNYIYDKKAGLFGQLICGPQKTSLFGKNADPDDYISGKIYKVKPDFDQYFRKGERKVFPHKEHIIDTVSTFQGVWNEDIKFDGKKYFDFKTQLPCELQDYPQPLPSNSTYRPDIIMLLQDKVKQAQEQKERTEQLQRNDRKLREKFAATRKKY